MAPHVERLSISLFEPDWEDYSGEGVRESLADTLRACTRLQVGRGGGPLPARAPTAAVPPLSPSTSDLLVPCPAAAQHLSLESQCPLEFSASADLAPAAQGRLRCLYIDVSLLGGGEIAPLEEAEGWCDLKAQGLGALTVLERLNLAGPWVHLCCPHPPSAAGSLPPSLSSLCIEGLVGTGMADRSEALLVPPQASKGGPHSACCAQPALPPLALLTPSMLLLLATGHGAVQPPALSAQWLSWRIPGAG